MLGEFEYLLITAAAGLGEEAYGAAIREEIEESTGRKCSIGALYTTIDRLEIKGLLETWMGEATAERGGRAKRMVRVTAKGVAIFNPAFDVTPAELVTAIITERGIAYPPFGKSLAKLKNNA